MKQCKKCGKNLLDSYEGKICSDCKRDRTIRIVNNTVRGLCTVLFVACSIKDYKTFKSAIRK